MMQFKGFKPQAMQRIAGNLGYQGDMSGFNDYLNQNPDKMSMMNMYQNKAIEMAKGGMVKKPSYAVGGVTTSATGSTADADGVFGDPRTARQDLNYNKETGEYTPVGFGLPITPSSTASTSIVALSVSISEYDTSAPEALRAITISLFSLVV